VADANGEAAHVVDVIDQVAESLWAGLTKKVQRGDWQTERLSTIELHGQAVKEAAETLASAIRYLADRIAAKEGR
jgi:hypothetical protein